MHKLGPSECTGRLHKHYFVSYCARPSTATHAQLCFPLINLPVICVLVSQLFFFFKEDFYKTIEVLQNTLAPQNLLQFHFKLHRLRKRCTAIFSSSLFFEDHPQCASSSIKCHLHENTFVPHKGLAVKPDTTPASAPCVSLRWATCSSLWDLD